MAYAKPYPILLGIAVLFLFTRPALAFGAGNIAGISKVEGQNWRHGDIEDTLLTILMARAVGGKKFDKMMVSRVYFGNWLRDYSQAIDVGTVKSISAEAIRLLLCVLGFLSFGYGSREFEVTADRLGTYRPEDHIDNPKDYADNVDARQYDRRLRGPVDERVELAIDEETGMKNYIANERANIMTSALHVRRLFSKCIELGRNYQRNNNKDDLYEALRLLGTGLHCLEDFLAHSNYVELALIEMGERDVFPHVGRRTQIRLRGARDEVYPLVTGTFGGVDFLHSVTGEVSDKLTQNEIEELEGTLQNSSSSDTSILENLLDMVPSGLFGGGDKKQQVHDIKNNANTAQLQNMQVSPREPEEYTRYIQQIFEQIMPAIQLHDEVLQGISEAIDKIPVLPKIIEQLEEQLSIFVFSVMAPFVVPVINQIKNELRTGSAEIIQSSKNEQHIVFNDDRCSDPTHSMLSKDHFSNILNEVAGRTASKVVGWVVPQIMEAWDNDNTDVDRLLNRIINGVMHHPAQRDQGEDGARDGRSIMFRTVEEWWNQKDSREQQDYRRKLSREGVERGENHKEGVHDTGHGSCKPIGMHKQFGGQGGGNTMEDQIATAAAGAIIGGVTGGISSVFEDQTGYKLPTQGSQGTGPWASGDSSQQERPSSKQGGGIGGLIGGLLSGFKGDEKTQYQSSGRTDDGAYQQTTTEYGHHGNRYGQAEEQVTDYPGGGRRTEYSSFEQEEGGGRHGGRRHEQGSGYVEQTETQPTYGGGYQQHTERKWEDNNRGEYRREEETSTFGGGYGGGGPRGDYASGRQEETYGGGRQEEYGGGRRDEFQGGGDFGGGRQEYGGGRQEEYGGGRRDEFQGGGGRGGWGGGEERREEHGGWGGERREEYGERREEGGGGFGGGMFGGGGESIVEGIAEQVADTFTQDDEDTRDTTRGGEWGGEERREEEYGDGDDRRREGGWGF
ncbi:Het-C-domain-containing protein [Coniochaeta hoffmannii]|uniref:Het-C-domain-containing protein n=1 Tax=Coniochaeta hoffmannii TaxID=91930 RepID=A0AA38RBE2_9PEZI|nr:Het-C-domain-containing protein [Coniochaeta hoffmannii]